MAFHVSVEHSPQSSRVILSGHHYNGSEMLLVAPLRKHLTFTFGSIDFGDLRNIRHAEHPQLANLSCRFILIRNPSVDELMVFSARRVCKNRNSL